MYIDTYPPESEGSNSPTTNNISVSLAPRNATPEFMEVVNKAKKPKKKYLGSHKMVSYSYFIFFLY